MVKISRIAPLVLSGALLAVPAMAQQQQQSPAQQSGQESQAQAQPQEGAPLHVGPDGIRQIQQALSQRGYEVGAADGEWNQQTQDALKQFQQSEGMSPTGNLNLSTVQSLGVDLTGVAQQQPQQAQTPDQQQQQPQQPPQAPID